MNQTNQGHPITQGRDNPFVRIRKFTEENEYLLKSFIMFQSPLTLKSLDKFGLQID